MSSNFSGSVVTVGVGKDYQTVNAAISAAEIGDVILIDPGLYNELVVVNKFVHLVGNTDDIESSTPKIYHDSTDLGGYDGVVNIQLDKITESNIGDPTLYIEKLYLSNTDCENYKAALGTDNSATSSISIVTNKCKIDIVDNDSFPFPLVSLDDSNVSYYFNYCYIDSDTGDDIYGYSTGFARLEFNNCIFPNGTGSYNSDSADVYDHQSFESLNYGYNYGANYYSLYYISGTIKQEGVVAERTVRLYNRNTGAFVAEKTSSSADGSFSFGIPNNTDEYYVIAFDNSGGDTYNALIYDKVTAA